MDDPGTALPEVRVEGLGCPSPALHGTSWVPGRQSVLWPAVPAKVPRPDDISSRSSRKAETSPSWDRVKSLWRGMSSIGRGLMGVCGEVVGPVLR